MTATTDRELIERLSELRKLKYMGDCKCGKCQLVPLDLLNAAIERLSAGSGWRDIASARKDRPIWVWCPAYQDLSPIVSLCEWHPDAGWCVDELREPALWTDYVAGNPPGAQPDTSAEEGAKHRLHLAWRLRNGEEFKNLPPIAADEIKQIAHELELAAAHNDLPILLSDHARLQEEVGRLKAAIMDALDPRCIGNAGKVEYFRDTDRSRAALINLRAALAGITPDVTTAARAALSQGERDG